MQGTTVVAAPTSPVAAGDSEVNPWECKACGHIIPTTKELGTQSDPLVFPFENQLLVLQPFVFPRGVKWYL
jgi:hypothetical protein